MAALPVLKLFFLGVKQLSKPVAGFIKNRAKNSPQFKQHVLNAAQLWHRVNVRASQAASNASAEARALRIKPLDEATAVATFTDILGEGVIYLVAAVALVVEYQMSAEKDAKKAAALESRFKNAETELENLRKESEALRTELKCSQQQLFHISQDLLELLQVCFFDLSLVFRNEFFSRRDTVSIKMRYWFGELALLITFPQLTDLLKILPLELQFLTPQNLSKHTLAIVG
jgi:hypothetical protein